jgi:hypothetical protein
VHATRATAGARALATTYAIQRAHGVRVRRAESRARAA